MKKYIADSFVNFEDVDLHIELKKLIQQIKKIIDDKGAANGYAPLDSLSKISEQYLTIVDNLTDGGSKALLSAQQGKALQGQINAIKTILKADDLNLDTIQEILDFIKLLKNYIDAILVNDLTTGGTTKALTAEMGKKLNADKESESNKSASIVVDSTSNTKFPTVKAVFDWCYATFRTWFLDIQTIPGIVFTLQESDYKKTTVFSGSNPISLFVPVNNSVPIAVGATYGFVVRGSGTVTVSGAGITFVHNGLSFVTGNTFYLTKIDTNTWAVDGTVVASQTVVSYTFSRYFGLISPNWYIGSDSTSNQIVTDSGTQNLATALSGFCVRNNVCIAPFDMKLISICAAMRPASPTKIGIVKGVPTLEHFLASPIVVYESPTFGFFPSRIIDLDNSEIVISKGNLVRLSIRHNQSNPANSSDTFTLTFKKI